jgi:CheY-like chemotaxis protein
MHPLASSKERVMQQLAISKKMVARKALVVDDSPLSRAAHTLVLTSLGYSVSTASNGLSGVAAAHLTSFDIITMDVQMPVMNGLECSRQIRLMERTTGRHATIVGVSGCDCELQCLSAGMDSFVSKPVTAVQLRAVVQALEMPREMVPSVSY